MVPAARITKKYGKLSKRYCIAKGISSPLSGLGTTMPTVISVRSTRMRTSSALDHPTRPTRRMTQPFSARSARMAWKYSTSQAG